MDMRPKIRPDVKEWWANRLTDGTYEQLREKLSAFWVETEDPVTGERFGHASEACCLGVLTGVAIEHGCPDIRWNPDRSGGVQRFDQAGYNVALELMRKGTWSSHEPEPEDFWTDCTNGDLPREVAQWAFDLEASEGLTYVSDLCDPVLDEEAKQRAVHLNDQMEWSFDEIAQLVRQLPEADEPAVKA